MTFHPSRQQGGGGWGHHLPLLFSGLVQTPLVVALKMLAGLRSCGYREVVAVEVQRWRRCDCNGNGGACYPRMHTGISMIPVCIWGLHKSPFTNMTSRTNRETSSVIVCALCAPVCAGQRFYSLSHKDGLLVSRVQFGGPGGYLDKGDLLASSHSSCTGSKQTRGNTDSASRNSPEQYLERAYLETTVVWLHSHVPGRKSWKESSPLQWFQL